MIRHDRYPLRYAGTMGVAALVAVLSLGGCSSSQWGEKETGGTLIGAALGGLLGAQVGSGTGRLVATGLGVAIGGFLGNETGRSLDRADESYHAQAARNALWNSPTNSTSTWRNRASGNRGQITPTADAYNDRSGRPCRSFHDEIEYSAGGNERISGTACRNADGSWDVI